MQRHLPFHEYITLLALDFSYLIQLLLHGLPFVEDVERFVRLYRMHISKIRHPALLINLDETNMMIGHSAQGETMALLLDMKAFFQIPTRQFTCNVTDIFAITPFGTSLRVCLLVKYKISI